MVAALSDVAPCAPTWPVEPGISIADWANTAKKQQANQPSLIPDVQELNECDPKLGKRLHLAHKASIQKIRASEGQKEETQGVYLTWKIVDPPPGAGGAARIP